jgi:hypothetical protein
MRCSIRLNVCQAFSLSAPNCSFCALAVCRFSIIPAKRKLVAVPVKVLLADAVEGAINTPLQQGKERFGGVRVYAVPEILSQSVIHCQVAAGESAIYCIHDFSFKCPAVGEP